MGSDGHVGSDVTSPHPPVSLPWAQSGYPTNHARKQRFGQRLNTTSTGVAFTAMHARRPSIATADRVRALRDAGRGYESIGRELGISPGLAYMLATGVPADFSDDLHPAERADRPELADSAQRLVNPHQHNPERSPIVVDWIRRRAAAELTGGDG
jgi:hypothetical protein